MNVLEVQLTYETKINASATIQSFISVINVSVLILVSRAEI